MDIKIKKEEEKERNLDVPNFKNSDEINDEFEKKKAKAYNVSPNDTMKLKKHEDDLELTSECFTTEIDIDDLDTLEIDTIGIVNDLKAIEENNRNVDTINLNKPEYVEKRSEDKSTPKPQPKKLKKISNKKLIWVLPIIVFGILVAVFSLLSGDDFLDKQLENALIIDDVLVYGESVNFIANQQLEELKVYNLDTKKYEDINTGKNINEQAHFNNLAEGKYYIFSNEKILRSDSTISVSYQTITRDKVNKNIEISTGTNGEIIIDVKDSSTPKVDILIDASQGDVQGFDSSDGKVTEQELSLKYALGLKSKLEKLGYNVKVTRDGDYVPGNCSYKDLYCSKGRVAMAYTDNPKLYIQLGFNGADGSGFEITDSHLNSHSLARILKSSLSSKINASERVSGRLENGIYNKTYNADGKKVDYLYLIRETGGQIMASDKTEYSDFNAQKVGSEAIDINLGYMSEQADYQKLDDKKDIEEVTDSLSTAIDQYIHSV